MANQKDISSIKNNIPISEKYMLTIYEASAYFNIGVKKIFISEYGTTILYAILTAIAGYLGIVIKKMYEKYINDKTKKDVAKTVVQAVEQIYKDLHGEEKLNKALELSLIHI